MKVICVKPFTLNRLYRKESYKFLPGQIVEFEKIRDQYYYKFSQLIDQHTLKHFFKVLNESHINQME